MQKPLFLCCFVFCVLFGQAQGLDTTLSLYFPINEYQLEKSEQEKLETFLKGLDSDRIVSSQLTAFCDAPGSSEYNKQLGQNRLNSVLAQLPKFISDSLSQSLNLGDQGKDDTSYTDKLRRVDLSIRLKPEAEYPSLSDLYAQLECKQQSFEIDPSKDTIIICEQGTQILISANSFQAASRKKSIIIEVTEVLKTSDMLTQNLTTTSKGEILESGGMIKITARQANKKLRLRRNRNLQIMIPTETPIENPQVFRGRMHENDSVDWRANGQVTLAPGDALYFTACCTRYGLPPCGFWCRLGNFFSGRSTNTSGPPPRLEANCNSLQHYLDKYQAENLDELKAKVSELLNYEELISTNIGLFEGLQELSRRERQARLDSGTASESDLNYYLFQSSNLGWINIDSFSKQPSWTLTKLEVPIADLNHTNVKMVFRDRKTILRPNGQNPGSFYFKDIPKGDPVTIVAVKYLKGEIEVAFEEIEIGDELPQLKFQKMTLPELRAFWLQFNS
jgi:hypothetical protein